LSYCVFLQTAEGRPLPSPRTIGLVGRSSVSLTSTRDTGFFASHSTCFTLWKTQTPLGGPGLPDTNSDCWLEGLSRIGGLPRLNDPKLCLKAHNVARATAPPEEFGNKYARVFSRKLLGPQRLRRRKRIGVFGQVRREGDQTRRSVNRPAALPKRVRQHRERAACTRGTRCLHAPGLVKTAVQS
jgi:hypothetical protein